MEEPRHDTFTIRTRLAASPDRVLAAFADPERRRRWIRMPGRGADYQEDFRVGGVDVARSTFPLPEGDQRLENRAVHLAIEPGRLVWSYTAAVDGVIRWASLVTVQLAAEGEGTALTWTEQVVFLAESDRPRDDLLHLRGAIRLRLNGLPAALEG
jgi:uncharacterized protein YndB with AHSA1/START domain